jgi:hypothetical protein
VPLATADNSDFRVLPDGSALLFSDAGALRTVHLDGSALATQVSSGATNVDDVSAVAIVYATGTTGTLETLRAARIGGSNVPLGSSAISEGTTPDGATLAARTSVVGTAGTLVVMPAATLSGTPIASGVVKSSFPDDTNVVFLDATGALSIEPIAGGAATLVQPRVAAFELVPDGADVTTRSRAAYVIASGAGAGLWLSSF